MADEKPFARVVPYEWRLPEGWGQWAVVFELAEGDDRCIWPGTESYARASADRLNRGVEVREAKWLGALKTAIDALHTARIGLTVAVADPDPRALKVVAEAIAAVSLARGDNLPPDYVPRAELVAALAKVKALSAAVEAIDPHDERPTVALVAAYLEANGLRKPDPETMTVRSANVALRAVSSRYEFAAVNGRTMVVDTAVRSPPASTQNPTRPHDPARIRRLMGWGASPREAEQHIEGAIRPIWSLAERLVELGIDFDYRRLDSNRDYYEAAQQVARRGVRGARINAPDMQWR